VSVRLRPSPYGGVTAVVFVPKELVVAEMPGALPGGRPRAALVSGPSAAPAAVPADGSAVGPAAGSAGVPPPIPLNRRMRTVPRRETPRPTPAPVASAPVAPAAPPAQPAQPPLSEDGLPRRIRQASLAPQLREKTPPPPDPAPATGPDRTPEEIRARMSALQSGTRRGRQDADTGPAPQAVPFRLAAAGAPVALDLPFTGPLGPIGTKEDWFSPSRTDHPADDAPPARPAPSNDTEEDA